MRLGLGLNITANSRGGGGTPAFSPSTLFSSGSQGVWLDPSDLSTMFSDRAGTTPVTTPGTVVGLRLDKSKGLVLQPEALANGDFSSGTTGWTGTVSASSGNLTVTTTGGFQGTSCTFSAVSGSTYKLSFSITSNTANWVIGVGNGIGSGNDYSSPQYTSPQTVTVYFKSTVTGTRTLWLYAYAASTIVVDYFSVKELPGNHATAPTDAARPIYGVEPKGGRRNLLLATDTLATQSLTVTAVAHTLAFTGTGTVTLTGASTAGPLVGTGAGNRVSLTFTPTAASLTLTVSGSVTLGQLELGSSATAYQKVVTAYNVTESGVATCHYVQYDGSDDSMSTAAIDFTATDKMIVFAGVRKLSDAAYGCITELGSTGAAAGQFGIFVNQSSNGKYYLLAGGTGAFMDGTTDTATVAPASDVLTVQFDRPASTASSSLSARIDGLASAITFTNSGILVGNFGNLPLFIGRRNNASLPFNGRDYGILVVGKAVTPTEITDTETWLAAKTSGVTI